MSFFPQINSDYIISQFPYASGVDWGSVILDVETGMRWAYPRRGAGTSDFPTEPLAKFILNFASITDSEINTLYTFFQSMRGSWGTFSFLDPSGNLLQFSELFNNAYWSVTGVISSGASDPYGNARAFSGASGVTATAVIGPSSGGMSGIVQCSSVWVKAGGAAMTATIGFKDFNTSVLYTQTYNLPANSWVRISKTLQLPTNNEFLFYLSVSSGSFSIFGAQVSPMKGEGAYIATAGGLYGYHQFCRFDTDNFTVRSVGPNQNQLQLPIQEKYN